MNEAIFIEEMEKLEKRFVLQKSKEISNGWIIIDKDNDIIYSFIEKDYFNTLSVKCLYNQGEELSHSKKMLLKYQMEFWFLYKHGELAYPDNKYTFKPLNGKEEGYYKITHNIPPIFEIIVRDEGSLGELAECLTELAALCKEKNKVIL